MKMKMKMKVKVMLVDDHSLFMIIKIYWLTAFFRILAYEREMQ